MESNISNLVTNLPKLQHTRSSTIADKPRDAFRNQSRSSNMVPFDMLGKASY